MVSEMGEKEGVISVKLGRRNSRGNWAMLEEPENRSPILAISAPRNPASSRAASPPQTRRSKARWERPRRGGAGGDAAAMILLRRGGRAGARFESLTLGGDVIQRAFGGGDLRLVSARLGVEPEASGLHLAHRQEV